MQNACMTTVTIRDLPKATHTELKARAAAKGQSLQEYLKAMLVEQADKPDIETLMAGIRKRKAENPSNLTSEKILEYKDLLQS